MGGLVFDKRTENLIELSWRFRELVRCHEELAEIDSTTWKEQLCSWSNEFEEIYAEVDWNSGEYGDYLDVIGKFADEKIFEFSVDWRKKDMKEMILSELVEAVKKMVGHEHEVMSHQVRKNNGVHLHAVIIKRPGEVVTPTIYVDKFIEMIEKEKMTVTEVAERVVEVYEQNKNLEIGVDVRDLADKEFVLEHVVYQLINKERNQDIVNTAPHKVLLDLAGIYRVVIRTDESGTASYVLTDEMMKRAGIAIEELDEAAMRNTESSDFIVKPMAEIMAEIMAEMMGGGPAEAINNSDDGPQMFVLTNRSRTNGANIMMCGKQLAALADNIDSDFYILPSSIHEVLAIPVSQIDHAQLKQMVRDVNDTQVEAEEILGYEVYRYDREAGELMIAE